MTPPLRPAVFLDRDGTLNVDHGYIHRVSDWEWIPGAREALARLFKGGFALVVVSNQAGVARGLYTVSDVERLHDWVGRQLAEKGVGVDRFYFCPHHPRFTSAACECRKPQPGMLLTAARELGLDLSRSFLVGDKAIDVQAARSAGVTPLLVRTGYGRESEPEVGPLAAAVVEDVGAAAEWILARQSAVGRL